MANLENLNFEVILDDAEFNKKIKEVEKQAKDLNVSLSESLEIKRKIAKADAARAKSAADATKEAVAAERLALAKEKTATQQAKTAKETERAALAQQKVATEAAKTQKAQAQAANAAKMGERALQGQNRLFRELSALATGYLSVRGAGQFVSQLAQVSGEYETQRMALSAMLQDAPAAEALLDKVRELALVSPYNFGDLAKYVKQLAAYGIPVSDLYDDTKMLADVAAGLGVDMSRIILAYGQIRSATVLRGQELRQLTEAGLPILDELAKKLSEVEGRFVSVGEVFDLVSQRKVSFEMVRDVLQDLTSEGGKFYNMQEVLAASLEGRISNLKDAFEDMLRTIGENQSEKLKGAVDFARKLVEHYQMIGKAIAGLVTSYGSYKAALLAVSAWKRITGLVENIRLIAMMRKELGLLTAAQQAFNVASAANIYIAIGAAVLGVVAALTTFNKKQKEALQTAGEASQAYTSEKKALDGLFEVAKDESRAKRDRAKAIDEINAKYGGYLDSVLKETSSVEDLAAAYDKATDAMRAKYLEEQRAAMLGAGQGSLNGATSKMWGRIEKAVSSAGLTDKARGAVMAGLQERLNLYGASLSAKDIYNEVLSAITKNGGKAPGSRALGSLYSDIWDFKDAQADFNRAEAQYSAFVSGFNSATSTAADAAGAAADKMLVKASAVAEGIARITEQISTLEAKAAGVGLNDEELKTLKSLREDLTDQRDQYRTLTGRDFGGKGSSSGGKYTQQTKDFYSRLEQEITGYEHEIAAAQIDAMEEGQEKSLARVELDHQKREQAIIQNYKQSLAAIEEEEKAAGHTFDPDNDPRAKALLSAYNKAILAEAMVTANAYAAIDKAAADEVEKTRLDYLQKFGTMEEKRLAIVQKYEKRIQEARKAGDEYLVASLEKTRDGEIYELQKEYSGLYALIFADADRLTRAQLAKAIALTQDEIRKAADSGDIQRLTELYARLRQQMETQATRDAWGFSGLVQGFRMIQEGRSDYDAAVSSGNKDGATNALSKQATGADIIKKSASEIGGAFSDLGAALSKFDGTLGEIGGMLSGLAANTDNIVTAFTSQDKGGIVAAGIAGTVNLVSMVADQINENRKAQEAWNLTVKQCAHEYAMLQLQQNEYQQANIFGVENPYKKAIDAMTRYTAALDLVRDAEAQLMQGQVQTGTRKGVSGKNIGAGIGAGAAIGAAIGTAVGGWAAGLGTVIGTAIGAIAGGIVGLVGGMKEVPVFESLLDKYGTIIDSGNTKNPFALNPAILADYEKLDDATKQIVDSWKDIQTEAEKAMDELHENFTDLCGEIGDQLRDTLVEAWRNRDIYAAIDEFHDYMGGVIEDILERMVFAATMQPLFDQLQKDMEASFLPGGDQDIVDELAAFTQKLPDRLTAFSEGMDQVQQAMQNLGFDLWKADGQSGEGAGHALQGLTEGTGNLLASYLNAIRGDVSSLRLLASEGWKDVHGIFEIMPSVADYLAKVEAHAANIAETNRDIAESNRATLNELRGIIVNEGSGRGVRSYPA